MRRRAPLGTDEIMIVNPARAWPDALLVNARSGAAGLERLSPGVELVLVIGFLTPWGGSMTGLARRPECRCHRRAWAFRACL
jgi:hypothetical protein